MVTDTTISFFQGLTSFGVAICSFYILSQWDQRRRWSARNPKALPHPPGPTGLPLIGSLFDIPVVKPWIVYNQWSKEYGSKMVYFEALGKRFLILNSQRTIEDLLVKRSEKYSDRPRMPMICEVMDYNWSIGFMGYGEKWRDHRKALNKHFTSTAVQKYHDIQLREARAFLLRMLQPDAASKLIPNIRQAFAALIMDASYGIRVSESNDPYIRTAEQAMDGLNQAAVPGAFLVDVIPALKYVPKWFPGAGWKRKAEKWNELRKIFIEKPFEEVKSRMERGDVKESILSALLADLPPPADERRKRMEEVAQNVPAVAYLGGSDTTVCALESFFVAMCLHPEVQRKGQKELDELIAATHSLPTFADRPRLHYINAIVEECLRWQIVAPLGLPHVLAEDDEYDGYFIPKGTLVIGNSWSILHDPQLMSEPSRFKPERYMEGGVFDPNASLSISLGSFGFGRRVCPGRHFTKDSLFSIIASTLAVYDIRPKKDDMGRELSISDDVTSGFVSHPVPFECVLTVRSAEREQLIYGSVEIE